MFFHTKLQKACKLKLNERYPLKKKSSGEHPVGHRHGCTQPHTKEQTSARLGQSHNIGHCVDEAWPHKHTEVQESRGEIRPSEWIQKTDHHKGNNVFQVILMASVIQEQRHQKETTSVEPLSLTQWSCHKTVYKFTFALFPHPDQTWPVSSCLLWSSPRWCPQCLQKPKRGVIKSV